MSSANKALARRFHEEIFKQGKLAVADEICAPNFVIHSPGLPLEMQRGPEGVKRFATMIRTAFTMDSLTNDDSIAEGDKVVNRWTNRGKHKGELFGIPATGKDVTVTGIDVFRIAGGKLVELWQNWDQLGMLQQLGVASSPAQARK